MEFDPRQLQVIRDLSDACSPSGFEDATCAVARSYAREFCTVKEDNLRNLYLYPNSARQEGPTLLLDAHGDEVGFMIHSIHDNGTLRFVTLGGMAAYSLPSQRVSVRNVHGEWIPGVIAAKPPHFMTAAERSACPTVQDMVIDVGATSKKEAVELFGMAIGEPAVPDVSLRYDEKRDILMGKALDCRIGCAALVETLRRLENEPMRMNYMGTVSSQEEVGERGVRVAKNVARPDIAICFEGCPADDTFTAPYAIQTALKKGPMLRYFDVCMITHPRFIRFALEVARKEGIPVQVSVREGGGTNGGELHNAHEGIPTIVIGIPVRYIHGFQSIASYEDYENAVRLAVAVSRALTAEILEGF